MNIKERNYLDETIYKFLNESNSIELFKYINSHVIKNLPLLKKKNFIENLKKDIKVITTKVSYNNLKTLYYPLIDGFNLSNLVNEDIFISDSYFEDEKSRNFFSELWILEINNFFEYF